MSDTDCLVDDTHAVMTRAALLELHEYNRSYPSGTIVGKRWRRRVVEGWLLGEYEQHPIERGHIIVRWREVELIDPCEGLAASWCPNHGRCVCGIPKLVGSTMGTEAHLHDLKPRERHEHADLDDPDCPLHSTGSDHADEYMIDGAHR